MPSFAYVRTASDKISQLFQNCSEDSSVFAQIICRALRYAAHTQSVMLSPRLNASIFSWCCPNFSY